MSTTSVAYLDHRRAEHAGRSESTSTEPVLDDVTDDPVDDEAHRPAEVREFSIGRPPSVLLSIFVEIDDGHQRAAIP